MTDLPRDATERLARASRRMNPGALGGTASGAAPVERRGLKGERLPGAHEHPHGHSHFDETFAAHGATANAIPSTLVHRTSGGQSAFATPTANGHAATMGWSLGEFLRLVGGTLTGNLTISAPGDRLIVGAHAFRDVSGKLLIQVPTGAIAEVGPSTGGDTAAELRLRAALIRCYGHLLPAVSATHDLGSTSLLWNDVHTRRLRASFGSATAPSVLLGNAGDAVGLMSSGGSSIYGLHLVGGGKSLFTFIDYTTDGSFHPDTDNYADCGIASRRWQDVHTVNSPTVGSDITRKHNVRQVSPDEATARVLRVADEGTIHFTREGGRRVHAGFSAQKVGEIHDGASAAYVDPSIEAGRRVNPCKGKPPAEWVAEQAEDPDNPTSREEARKRWRAARERFDADTEAMKQAPKGLRVEELVADLYASLAHAHRRIDALEAQLAGGA